MWNAPRHRRGRGQERWTLRRIIKYDQEVFSKAWDYLASRSRDGEDLRLFIFVRLTPPPLPRMCHDCISIPSLLGASLTFGKLVSASAGVTRGKSQHRTSSSVCVAFAYSTFLVWYNRGGLPPSPGGLIFPRTLPHEGYCTNKKKRSTLNQNSEDYLSNSSRIRHGQGPRYTKNA